MNKDINKNGGKIWEKRKIMKNNVGPRKEASNGKEAIKSDKQGEEGAPP